MSTKGIANQKAAEPGNIVGISQSSQQNSAVKQKRIIVIKSTPGFNL